MITIQKNEDVLDVRSRMLHGIRSEKVLSVKKYSGKLKLKEEALAYQKRVRQEWDEHEDCLSVLEQTAA